MNHKKMLFMACSCAWCATASGGTLLSGVFKSSDDQANVINITAETKEDKTKSPENLPESNKKIVEQIAATDGPSKIIAPSQQPQISVPQMPEQQEVVTDNGNVNVATAPIQAPVDLNNGKDTKQVNPDIKNDEEKTENLGEKSSEAIDHGQIVSNETFQNTMQNVESSQEPDGSMINHLQESVNTELDVQNTPTTIQ